MDDLYQNSLCDVGNNWLHKFVLWASLPEVYMEICERCHTRIEHKLDKQGRYDKRKYISYHIREMLQPHNKLYFHEYPNYGKEKIADKLF